MPNPSIFHYSIFQNLNRFIIWRLLCLILRKLIPSYVSSMSTSLLYNNFLLTSSISSLPQRLPFPIIPLITSPPLRSFKNWLSFPLRPAFSLSAKHTPILKTTTQIFPQWYLTLKFCLCKLFVRTSIFFFSSTCCSPPKNLVFILTSIGTELSKVTDL